MYKALLIGCGNIGAGEGLCGRVAFPYTHVGAYRAAAQRVVLAGLVDQSVDRLVKAARSIEAAYFTDLEEALAAVQPDIVSIATQPESQESILTLLEDTPCVKGVWCEKPYLPEWTPKRLAVQVNHIRRFEPIHAMIAEKLSAAPDEAVALTVSARGDLTTVVHFADLGRFWGVHEDRIVISPSDGTEYLHSEYELLLKNDKIRFREGGAVIIMQPPTASTVWPGEKVPSAGKALPWKPTFMQAALENLLDFLEGTAALVSPASDAMESTRLAHELLRRFPCRRILSPMS